MYNWARICLAMETVRDVCTVYMHTFLWTADIEFTTIQFITVAVQVHFLILKSQISLVYYFII